MIMVGGSSVKVQGRKVMDSQVPLIHLQSVGRTFRTLRGEDIEALRDVTFDIMEGEFLTIVAASGCHSVLHQRVH